MKDEITQLLPCRYFSQLMLEVQMGDDVDKIGNTIKGNSRAIANI